MNGIAEFEKQVIRRLCGAHVSSSLLEELFEMPGVDYEYSGAGYFLTFSHSELPVKRIVCDKPDMLGQWNGIDAGFVVFLENNELTLECHTLGSNEIPDNYREQPVKVSSPGM